MEAVRAGALSTRILTVAWVVLVLLGTEDDTKDDCENDNDEDDDTETDPAFAPGGPCVLHGLLSLLQPAEEKGLVRKLRMHRHRHVPNTGISLHINACHLDDVNGFILLCHQDRHLERKPV